MGYFYTAYCARNDDWKDNAEMLFKIGETCQAIEKRIGQIHAFGLRCLKLNNDTKAQRLFIESYVRLKLSEYYKNLGNDYFLYYSQNILNPEFRNSEAIEISNKAIRFAEECCTMINLNYENDWCSYYERIKHL